PTASAPRSSTWSRVSKRAWSASLRWRKAASFSRRAKRGGPLWSSSPCVARRDRASARRRRRRENGGAVGARREPRRALLALKPALTSYDWPLGSDARVTRAQGLMALGRKAEATEILEKERKQIELHRDRHRLERLRAAERGETFRVDGDSVRAHLHLADRAARNGNTHDELEHYRAARVLLEAGVKAPTGS